MQRRQSDLSCTTTKKESKKDKTTQPSRKWFQNYEPDLRGNVTHSATFPYGLNGPHPSGAFPQWVRPNVHHQPHGAAAHLYPGQQMFMQHRPFGSDGNFFGPVHFSHPLNHFLYPPRNHPRYQGDGGQLDYFNESFYKPTGKGLKNDYGQGDRPKSNVFQNGRKKCFKKRKNQNNSSKIKQSTENEGKIELAQGNVVSSVIDQSNFNSLSSSFQCHQTTTMEEVACSPRDTQEKQETLDFDLESCQGAVGGEGCNVFEAGSVSNNLCSIVLPFDKNLIDEGAICDLDKMFQHQEIDDNDEFYNFNDDFDKGNISDDDSDLENCSYVYDPKHSHSLEDNAYGKTRLSSVFDASKRVEVCPGAPNGFQVEALEDTGDFIDTDLPAQKHLLSSSDEIDSHSYSSDTDKEVSENSPHKGPKLLQDFNSNDLSTYGSDLPKKVGQLSISKDITDGTPFPSSQYQKDTCSSGSESENESSAPLSKHSGTCAVANNNRTPMCLDGAAASQPHVEQHQALMSCCPPGAECEITCFHSNLYSLDSQNYRPREPIKIQPNEHVAFTASSAIEGRGDPPHPACSGCSATSEGEASCSLPRGLLLGVNDLNTCCHHSHVHVANGFNDADSPGANFSNDESNRLQKVFVKFSSEDKLTDGDSHSASSCDLEDADGRKLEKNAESGGSEDPLSHDSGDNVDMVLLPMEEEIEPVHHMSAGLCTGCVDDDDDLYHELNGQLAMAGKLGGANLSLTCDDHQYLYSQDQNPLGNGMPSKEFYELIKTVSTADSFMRFFDKDGQDVQRQQPLQPCDDEGKDNSGGDGPTSTAERLKVDRVMIWNEYEAYVMQFKQIAVSACGQTAVLNVLKALKISCEKSVVVKVIQTNLRREDAGVPEYLFSRAKAGTTAEELMRGVEKLSNGAIGGRFFHFWPPRKIKLLQWLAYWMKRGAIPMATLNLQLGPHSLWQVPDSWHHQMVYGVSHQGLYLTNPLEIVSERTAMKQLTSDSVLMVRRHDIIARFRETTDLGQLLNHPDTRWRTMNVLGQVVNVLREFNMPSVPGYRLQVTSHINIPAEYKAGITLFMPKDKSAWAELLNAPELPLE